MPQASYAYKQITVKQEPRGYYSKYVQVNYHDVQGVEWEVYRGTINELLSEIGRDGWILRSLTTYLKKDDTEITKYIFGVKSDV